MIGASRAVGAYAKMDKQTAVLSASPVQLISILYEHALSALRAARLHIQAERFEEKGSAIDKAMRIVGIGLRGALDFEKGGETMVELDRLYDYIGRLLIEASVHNRDAPLATAQQVLETLADGWKALEVSMREPA